MTRRDWLMGCVMAVVVVKKSPASTLNPTQGEMELSRAQSRAPPGTGSIPSRE